MKKLVRQFVCPNCGGTAPLSDRPYQECASCNTVGDYDYGVARVHPEWPAHEALFSKLFHNNRGLGEAFAARDLEGYAKAYAKVFERLIGTCPGLYPHRVTDPAYRTRLAQFHAYWQAATCLDGSLVRLDHAFRRLRQEVVVSKQGMAKPSTLWPLIDHAKEHFAEIQRVCDFLCKPPDNFTPRYVERWMISATLSEWLPQLALDQQRELVERMGVGNQYLAPGKEKVACKNCGGAIEIEPGFVTIHCPFCAAQIHEERVNFRDLEMDRWRGSGYDEAFGWIESKLKQPPDKVVVLDGPVFRKNKQWRMITLRAVLGDRHENFWRMFDKPDSPKLADVLLWIEQYTTRRKLPLDKLAYREHPKCLDLQFPPDALPRRLAEAAPGATPYLANDGDGYCIEAMVDGAVVRLVFDEDNKRRKAVATWLASLTSS